MVLKGSVDAGFRALVPKVFARAGPSSNKGDGIILALARRKGNKEPTLAFRGAASSLPFQIFLFWVELVTRGFGPVGELTIPDLQSFPLEFGPTLGLSGLVLGRYGCVVPHLV